VGSVRHREKTVRCVLLYARNPINAFAASAELRELVFRRDELRDSYPNNPGIVIPLLEREHSKSLRGARNRVGWGMERTYDKMVSRLCSRKDARQGSD
jgi:hypothetical protein